jgi:cell wall-associated NlpC family hydrolase
MALAMAGAAAPGWAEVNPTSPEEAEGEIRRGENTAQSWEQRAQARLQQSAVKIEPTLSGHPGRAQAYIDFFPTEFLDDPRQFPFKVEATEQQDGTVALTGYVGFEENRTTLLQFLGVLGVQIGDETIEVLPSANLGEEKFGFVSVTAAPYWAEPREGSERVTVGLMGDPVFLLRAEKDGFLLAMGNEGYVGHIHESNIVRTNAEGFDARNGERRARLLRNETTAEGTVLPAGAILFLEEEQTADGMVAVVLPTGGRVHLPPDAVAIAHDTPGATEAALATAHTLMGTPYVWGGRSLEGIDCSGLVQTSFRTVGISLPRDSDQQALVGTLTGTRWHRGSMQRGDAVYFVGRWGTISHTGIYLGDGQYIEAAGPGVQITSLREGDENYSERRARTFVFSKRFIE